MHIYFVRHGKSKSNQEGVLAGWFDTPLVDAGREEARRILSLLPNDFSKIYSSDLSRCKETAEIINQRFNLPITYDSRLRERNFGSLAGQKIEGDIAEMLDRAHKYLDYDFRPYGGENSEDVKKRVLDFMSDIRQKETGKKILVVTHDGVIRVVHKELKDSVPEEIHNAAIHDFHFPDLT